MFIISRYGFRYFFVSPDSKEKRFPANLKGVLSHSSYRHCEFASFAASY